MRRGDGVAVGPPGEVLGNSAATAAPSKPNINSTQEALVVQYLASVGAHGDNIDEDRLTEARHRPVAAVLCCTRA